MRMSSVGCPTLSRVDRIRSQGWWACRAVSVAAALVLVSGCASGGSRPGGGGKSDDMEGSRVQTAVLQTTAGTAMAVNMVANTNVNRTVVPAAPDVAFQALAGAYGKLNIAVTDLNQATRTLGNPTFRTRRRIGDVPTMRALDCGGDSGMPNAETYQLTLSIQSRVIAGDAAGTSVVESTVEGVGRSATTSGSSDVRCSSLGALEKRIGELVRESLAAGK